MIPHRRHVLCLVAVLSALAACVSVEAQGRPNVVLVEKRVKDLGPLPMKSPPYPGHIKLSPAGERLACVLRRDGKKYVVCGGIEGPLYDDVHWVKLSPDGKRLAYAAYRGHRDSRRTFVVCDGKETACGANFDAYSAVFSPDSRHLCFGLGSHDDTRHFIVFDGEKGPEFYALSTPVFSPDSKHWTFVGRRQRRGGCFVFCDGKRGPEVSRDYSSPLFSPDSRRLIYWRGVGRRERSIPGDGQGEIVYERVGSRPVISADGKRMAFRVQRGRKHTIAVDGETHAAYDGATCPRFSPDGKRLAFRAFRAQLGPKLGERNFIVCDGKALRSYDWVCGHFHVFSPDSRHLAYVAWRGTKGNAPAKWRGAEWFVICDGREGPPVDWKNHPYAWPQVPVFSPDSKHLAYFATRGRKQFVVVDGSEGPKHPWVRIPKKPCEVKGKFRYVVGDEKRAWLVEVEWPKDLDWTHGLTPVERPEEE